MSPNSQGQRPPSPGADADHYLGVGSGGRGRQELVQVRSARGDYETVPYAEPNPNAGRPRAARPPLEPPADVSEVEHARDEGELVSRVPMNRDRLVGFILDCRLTLDASLSASMASKVNLVVSAAIPEDSAIRVLAPGSAYPVYFVNADLWREAVAYVAAWLQALVPESTEGLVLGDPASLEQEDASSVLSAISLQLNVDMT